MKIQGSQIAMTANHDLVVEQRDVWIRRVDDFDQAFQQAWQTLAPDQQKPLFPVLRPVEAMSPLEKAGITPPGSLEDDLKRGLLRLLLRILDQVADLGFEPLPMTQSFAAPRATVTTYHQRELAEQETSRFSASGTITTWGGKEINFSLESVLGRSYFERVTTADTNQQRPLVDPLVVNFAGHPATISGPATRFDLNSDGTAEEISFVGAGSGFLAWDRNSDGVINDGRELFGPLTNNAFSELAMLDGDGNGWLDESDTAFGQLRVWSKDGQGQDVIHDLRTEGIGAIYLDHLDTPFRYTDAQNQTLATVDATGIFVGEDGSVGTVQAIDLAVREPVKI